MSESEAKPAAPAPDPVDQAMAQMRQKAMLLIGGIDPVMLDNIHAIIAGVPAMTAAATLGAALADVLCASSKTDEGLNKNVLITSEMILKVAAAGMAKKPAPGSIIH